MYTNPTLPDYFCSKMINLYQTQFVLEWVDVVIGFSVEKG
jgi:hypothetical protein